MSPSYITQLKREVNHWYEFVIDEEDRLNRCTDDETKVFLRNRLVGGYRILQKIEAGYYAQINAYNAAQEDIKEFLETSNVEREVV